MKWEYLLLDAIILSGPVLFSFDRQLRYVSRWPRALLASIIVLVPYAAWDACVAGKHWSFNENYTLPIRIFGLPPGEWLFFIIVPFVAIFVWECVCNYRKKHELTGGRYVQYLLAMAIPAGIFVLFSEKTYSGLALISMGVTVAVDWALGPQILRQSRAYIYLAIITCCFAVFNGYLTARPVVLYSESHILGWRVGSIPVEDFGYCFGLVLLSAVIYEYLGKTEKRSTDST